MSFFNGKRKAAMDKLLIRPLDFDTDLDWLTRLGNLYRSEQASVANVREWYGLERPERVCRVMVAFGPGGERIGYCEAIHETWNPGGQYSLWVQVDPRFERQGAGSALFNEGLAFTQLQGATSLTSEVHDDCPACLEFATRRGFSIERHIFESVLDLDSFDESPYQALLADLQAQGLRIVSLADMDCSPQAKTRLYEINRLSVLDIPGREGDFYPYDEFEQLVMGADWFNPAGQFLAALGQDWVGLAAVRLMPETQGAYNLITGVLRPFRGRKIALALKLRAMRYARSAGVRYMRTNNDSLNAPMLAINQKLGYQPVPGLYRLHANPAEVLASPSK